MNRRSFLGRSVGATTALVAGSLLKPFDTLWAQTARSGFPVRFPPDWDGSSPLIAAPVDLEV